MSECQEQYESVCRNEFGELHAKPGIHRRIDRLETAEKVRSRLTWLITGAAVTLAASYLWQQIFGG